MPNHPTGYNAALVTRNFGTRQVRVSTITYGIEIIASEAESATRKAFYPSAYSGSSFDLTLLFMDWEERERFSAWMRGYMRKTIAGRGFYASMTVHCPVRNFTRVGIPQGSVDYGEGLTDVGYTVSLSFLGVTDPADPLKDTLASGVSYFKWPKRDKQSRYFYPAGQQLSGAANLEGTIFDPTPEVFTGPDILQPILEGPDTGGDQAGTGQGDFTP